jgi:hypothetical protein
MTGGDENSARDMGIFIAGCKRLRKETGATILIIHHTGKDGQLERGSSALRGAADTMIALRNESGVIHLTCEKQKDGPPFEQILLQLQLYNDSCIVTRLSAQTRRAQLKKMELQILHALAHAFKTEGASNSELRDVVAEAKQKRAFQYALGRLLELGFIRRGEGKRARYFVTDSGLSRLGETEVSDSDQEQP